MKKKKWEDDKVWRFCVEGSNVRKLLTFKMQLGDLIALSPSYRASGATLKTMPRIEVFDTKAAAIKSLKPVHGYWTNGKRLHREPSVVVGNGERRAVNRPHLKVYPTARDAWCAQLKHLEEVKAQLEKQIRNIDREISFALSKAGQL